MSELDPGLVDVAQWRVAVFPAENILLQTFAAPVPQSFMLSVEKYLVTR